MDTQKSMDDLSEDDINYMGAGRNDAAVHEGGGRPGSNENNNSGIRRRIREN